MNVSYLLDNSLLCYLAILPSSINFSFLSILFNPSSTTRLLDIFEVLVKRASDV
jgi:hypothetical protein